MVNALLEALGAALSIWEHKEKHKYIDKYMKLRSRYYEEYNKPSHARSDAVLDNLEFELRLVAIGFTAQAGKPDTADKS